MKGSILARSDVEGVQIEATVIKCRCGNPTSHPGELCPAGVKQALGIVAEWRRPWYSKAWRRFKTWLSNLGRGT